MAYDNYRKLFSYYLGSVTFTSTDKVFVIDVQPTENVEIFDVETRVTTTCAGGTTTPRIEIGDGSDTDRYFLWNLGTTAGGNNVLRSNTPANRSRFKERPAKGQDLTITLFAATGAGAAGVADVWVHVNRW
jgi:hypothetical protein